MRFAVFVLALLGTALTAVMGFGLLFGGDIHEWIMNLRLPGLDRSIHAADLMKIGIFLLIGTGFGLFGALLVLCRYGPQAGVLMIVSATGPAILNPVTLAGTGLLALTGVLSFFVRHRAAVAVD
jgi:hypothetical protein